MALRTLARRWRKPSTTGRSRTDGPPRRIGGLRPGLELFEGLRDRQLARAGRLFTELTLPAGKVLGHEGALGRDFVIVIDGQVAVIHDDAPLAVLTAGCHFGELAMLHWDDSPELRASFHALGPVRVAVANRREFRSLLAMFPLIDERIRTIAERRQGYLDDLRDGRTVGAMDSAHPGYPVHPVHDVDART